MLMLFKYLKFIMFVYQFSTIYKKEFELRRKADPESLPKGARGKTEEFYIVRISSAAMIRHWMSLTYACHLASGG
jgi:hypothetical protein